MSDLSLTGVSVSYGDAPAVDGVSLDVPAGSRLAILGPSGCGKSSLLRAIAGLEPSSGTIRLGGRDLAGVPTHRRGAGLMFQSHALFPHLNVLGNVAFGLRLQGKGSAAALEMLELVGLADRADAPISELSGGEQQRVALARTLAPEPAVVLLDEPLGALDRVLREDLLGTMIDIFDRLGTTVMFVTHDQSEAMSIGHRVALMDAGRIRQIGAPAEVWNRPADEWVARFLGLRNVFSAEVLRSLGVAVSDGAWLLRPDLLRLAPDGSVLAEVTGVTFRGGSTVLRCDVLGGEVDVAVWVTGDPPQLGESVLLSIPAAAVVPLGPAS